MSESILTIAIAGLLAGFFFSIPIAGPVSILITTNALKGRFQYCNLVNFGASFATFTYVFFAVFGLSKLYHLFKPAVPYLFIIGSGFLIFMGLRIFRTKIDFEHIEDKSLINKKIKKKDIGGFYTGLIINFLNPTLLISWLTSTFLVLSFVSSLGFNTGGLNMSILQSVQETGGNENRIVYSSTSSVNNPLVTRTQEIGNFSEKQASIPRNFHFLISILFASSICAGSIIWFYILAISITRFRRYIKFEHVTAFIKSMGIVLCIVGLYFGYLAAGILFNLQI